MPLPPPARRTDFPLQILSRGFQEALIAYSQWKRSPSSADPSLVRRAGWAQYFLYRQGLNPSPRPMTQAQAAGIEALIARIEQIRADWAAAVVNGQATENSLQRSAPGNQALAAEIAGNPSMLEGINYLKTELFAPGASGSSSSSMSIDVSTHDLVLAPLSFLDMCHRLANIVDVLARQIGNQERRDRTMGPTTPDYNRWEFRPVADIDFDAYRREAIKNGNGPANLGNSPIFAPAPQAAAASSTSTAPSRGTGIYDTLPADFANPAANTGGTQGTAPPAPPVDSVPPPPHDNNDDDGPA